MSVQRDDAAQSAYEQFEDLPMRVGVGQIKELSDEHLQFAAQMGIEDVLISPFDPHDEYDLTLTTGEVWTLEELTALRERVEAAGLRLYGLETLPYNLYRILIDDDPQEKIDVVKESLKNIGRAGIPVQGYSGHPPTGVSRTDPKVLRGGAKATAFDPELVDEAILQIRGGGEAQALDPEEVGSRVIETDRELTEEAMWETYELFLQEVIPVAEEYGVTLGLHPTDPPIEQIAGVPLLFRNFENHKRAMELYPSPNHGIKLGMGCWSEMGEDLVEVIKRFGGENIVYVHFRDVVGTAETGFYETFIDDPESNCDEYEVMKTLYEEGFTGVMTPDHVPDLPNEKEWPAGGFRGRAFTIGYLRGMLKAIRSEAGIDD